MPRIEYEKDVPEDRRWQWMCPVPQEWLHLEPDLQIDRAMKLVEQYGGKDSAPEFSTNLVDGVPHFFINWDGDPDALFVSGSLPVIEPTDREKAISLLMHYRNKARDPKAPAPTESETQQAIVALISTIFPEG